MTARWRRRRARRGAAFYDRLQGLLSEAGFDAFRGGGVQAALRPADGRAHRRRRGGRVRRRTIGCFVGLDERGGARTHIRCASSCGCRTSRRSPIILGCRARSRLPARGARAVLRPCPRSRRHAGLAARTGEYPQALPDPCRRLQSRRLDARAARVRGRRQRQARAVFIFILQTGDILVLGPSSTPNPPRSSSPSASRQAQTEIGASSTGCESGLANINSRPLGGK